MSLALVSAAQLAYGYEANKRPLSGFGKVADNMMDPVILMTNFVGIVALTLGFGFYFGALIKYMQHRVNPLAVPISTVIILIIMATILVCLPFAYKIASAGIPMSF
jgi:hypothetical protein